MTENEKPLVTFALFAYNQEKYIREAVEAALAQDYSPLEIIISDDCSVDSTFVIMREIFSAYEGPHAVQLHRNPVNLGLGAHVAKVHAIARGEIIVHAAGDDISMPERVSRIVTGFMSAPVKPSLVESDAVLIDEDGVTISRYHTSRPAGMYQHDNPWIKSTAGGGATYAVARTLVNAFTPIPNDFIAEDGLLSTRANLINGVLYIPDSLVKYRVTRAGLWNAMNSNQLSSRQIVANESRWSWHRMQVADQTLEDIAQLYSSCKLTNSKRLALDKDIYAAIKELQIWLRLLEGSAWESTLSLLRGIFSHGHINIGRWFKMFLIRWAGPIRDLVKNR